MKKEDKQILEKRIELIKSRIIEANNLYQKYTSNDIGVSLRDYFKLKDAVKKFNKDEFVPKSTPRGYDDDYLSMYESLKNHKSLTVRMAVKKLVKELAKFGIDPEAMVAYDDPRAEKIMETLDRYEAQFNDKVSNMNIPEVVKIRMRSEFRDRVMTYYYGVSCAVLEDCDLPPLDERVEKIYDIVIHNNQVAKAQKEAAESKQEEEISVKPKAEDEPQGPAKS